MLRAIIEKVDRLEQMQQKAPDLACVLREPSRARMCSVQQMCSVQDGA